MRESNFAFPAQNRACVCISSQLYDRRALDTNSALPLFNSLSHLTYLTSTSPRIREILTFDGGLERLVRIARDFCAHMPAPESPAIFYGLQPPGTLATTTTTTSGKATGKNFDRAAAYRFSLAFQCVANVGVRGSEHIRSRVVQAGTLDVVGCVLEHWLQSKGYAVLPSSSASGLPRESKEERAMRRAALLAAQQQQQATEIARALERAQHLQVPPALAIGPPPAFAPAPGPRRQVLAPIPHAHTHAHHRPQPIASTSTATANASASASDEEMHDAPSSSSNPSSSRPSQRPSSSSSFVSTGSGAAGSPDTSANATPVGSSTPTNTVVVGARDRSGTIVARPSVWDREDQRARRRGRTVTQRGVNRQATDTEDDADGDADVEMRDEGAQARTVGIVAGDDDEMGGVAMAGNLNMLIDGIVALEGNDDLAMGAPPGAPGATPVALTDPHPHGSPAFDDQEDDAQGQGQTQATPRQPAATLPPAPTPRASRSHHQPWSGSASGMGSGSKPKQEEGPYREEDVLIALQLLAYLSKYPHVRQAFYGKRVEGARPDATPVPGPALHRESALGGFARALVGRAASSSSAPSHPVAGPSTLPDSPPPPPPTPQAAPLYPRPSMTQSPNIFALVERFTFRPSANELLLSSPPDELSTEIQYWAGVIMRNACRKDESRGGVRQCANMLCGKWEESPRQFAKCRRCRKAKYCGKECQSRAWSEGHRFWCSTKEDEVAAAQGEGEAGEAAAGEDATAATMLAPHNSPEPQQQQTPAHAHAHAQHTHTHARPTRQMRTAAAPPAPADGGGGADENARLRVFAEAHRRRAREQQQQGQGQGRNVTSLPAPVQSPGGERRRRAGTMPVPPRGGGAGGGGGGPDDMVIG
ncbi:hypothetical protein EXIGLDRAFT_844764 [Exidia glandulosa HHB12029]|uniref:MYND-type domain-containing protein n=1 Tax=Exidia glandulosa HHB12029 TaxID=1314781 RepID=A0A165BUL3_EXIGL|nr:hypothetical protein EXIGLDRAFT_844764 [Exidia glandulosa HHB12029]